MKAVICDMNYDPIKGRNLLEKFAQDYPMFADSRECGLLKVIHPLSCLKVSLLLKRYK